MIKAALIKHRSFSETPDDLVQKISEAAQKAEIILGPEYSMFYSQNRVNTPLENHFLEEEFKKISENNNCVIVPGTMPHRNETGIQMTCPIFVRGCFKGYVAKKSNKGDSEILSRMGEIRVGAKYEEADFAFTIPETEKRVRILICGDQGRYDFEPTDIELVTSYDSSPGVHIHPETKSIPRSILISDGLKGKTLGFFYTGKQDPKTNTVKINPLPIRAKNADFDIYHIR